jgi:hypothetical protein
VGILLSGFLGALLVFVLGVAREWWRNERERRGLLRLLLAEIEHNAEVVRTIAERLRREFPVEDLIGHPDFPTLKTRTWVGVRGRAAALLPSGLLAELDGYYSPLETLLTLAGFSDMASDSYSRTLLGKIEEGRPAWVLDDPRNPYKEQLCKFLDAQERTPARIEEYLTRPWWGLLFLRADRLVRHRVGREGTETHLDG